MILNDIGTVIFKPPLSEDSLYEQLRYVAMGDLGTLNVQGPFYTLRKYKILALKDDSMSSKFLRNKYKQN